MRIDVLLVSSRRHKCLQGRSLMQIPRPNVALCGSVRSNERRLFVRVLSPTLGDLESRGRLDPRKRYDPGASSVGLRVSVTNSVPCLRYRHFASFSLVSQGSSPNNVRSTLATTLPLASEDLVVDATDSSPAEYVPVTEGDVEGLRLAERVRRLLQIRPAIVVADVLRHGYKPRSRMAEYVPRRMWENEPMSPTTL